MGEEVQHLKELLLSKLEAVKTLLVERDQRYEERHEASQDALASALKAAEKAGDKTEAALSEYKAGSNEWRGTLNDIVSTMLLRADYDREHRHLEERLSTEVKRLDEKIAGLITDVKKAEAEKGGRLSSQELFMKNLPALAVAIIVILGAIIGVAYAIKR